VAIKVLKRAANDEGCAKEFRKECETLQAIKHPNLIVFLGAGTTSDGKAFMVRCASAAPAVRLFGFDSCTP
jgi:hypothetical protein